MNANIKYQVIRVNENNEVINHYGVDEVYNCKNKKQVKQIINTSNFKGVVNCYYKVVNVKKNILVKRLSDKRLFINNILASQF